jgi:hypothetical protein
MSTTKLQVAEYVRDLSIQLEFQARTVGLDTTAYLLEMVTADTSKLIDSEREIRAHRAPLVERTRRELALYNRVLGTSGFHP